MFERFTDRSRRILVLAQEEARLLGHDHIGTEHILLGGIHEGEGAFAMVLTAMTDKPWSVLLDDGREKVERIFGKNKSRVSGSPQFTPRAKQVFEFALREALQLGHNYIAPEHILLGLVRESEGVGAQILTARESQGVGAEILTKEWALTLPEIRHEVIRLLSNDSKESGWTGSWKRIDLLGCSLCGAVVADTWREVHENWHKDLKA